MHSISFPTHEQSQSVQGATSCDIAFSHCCCSFCEGFVVAGARQQQGRTPQLACHRYPASVVALAACERLESRRHQANSLRVAAWCNAATALYHWSSEQLGCAKEEHNAAALGGDINNRDKQANHCLMAGMVMNPCFAYKSCSVLLYIIDLMQPSRHLLQ